MIWCKIVKDFLSLVSLDVLLNRKRINFISFFCLVVETTERINSAIMQTFLCNICNKKFEAIVVKPIQTILSMYLPLRLLHPVPAMAKSAMN